MLVSYAQNFEDVLLWRCFKGCAPGFYIDVGAQDPIVDSVSRAFYDQGWRGCHVEPTSQYADLLRENRPDELVFQLALGRENGTSDFWTIEGTGLSTTDQSIADEHVKRGFSVSKGLVPVITLDELFLKIKRDDVYWLKIDVEGGERTVLEGWRSSSVRPWVVVLESTRPMTMLEDYQGWESIVLAKGYEFAKFDGLNRFYVHREHLDLKKALALSPNVFDDFSLSGLATHSFSALFKRRSEEFEREILEAHRKFELIGARVDELELSLSEANNRLEKAHAHIVTVEECARLAGSRVETAEAQARAAEERMQSADVRAQAAEDRAQFAEIRAQSSEVRVQSAESRAQSAESRAQSAESRAQSAESRAQSAESRAQSAESRIQSAEARTLVADTRLHIAEARVLEAEELVRDANVRASCAEAESVRAAQAVRDAELRALVAADEKKEIEVRLITAKQELAASNEALSFRAEEANVFRTKAEELLCNNREYWQRIETISIELLQAYASIEYWHSRVLLLHHSTSWRLTAPVRVFGRWLKWEKSYGLMRALTASSKQILKQAIIGAMSEAVERPRLRRFLGGVVRKVPGLHGYTLNFARRAGLISGYVVLPETIPAPESQLSEVSLPPFLEERSPSMSRAARLFYREFSQATVRARRESE